MKKFKIFSAVVAIVMVFTMSVAAEVYTYSYDFNDDMAGDSVSYTDMGADGWNEGVGTADSMAVITEGNDGCYVAVGGFTELRGPIILEEYAFGIALKAGIGFNGEGGVFVRSANPANYTVYHTAHNSEGWDMTLNFFESDWYREAGGQTGESGVGGSGIAIAPMADGVRLTVKTYMTDGATIGNVSYMLAYPAGASADTFTKFDFFDDGSKIEILANGEAFATVELSDPGKTYETDKVSAETPDEYFGKAVIKDATGAELGTVENTRICSSSSMVALGTRATNLDFDDLYLYTGEGSIAEKKNEAPAGDETDAPAATDAPATGAPATNAPATSAPAADATDDAAATGASTNPAETNASGDKDDSEGGLPTAAIIGIVVAVVAVIAVAVVVVMKKKK